MVIMENCCLPENSFNELLQEIDRCHLGFLVLEESREKIEKRNKLEEYIHEYLSMSGHYHKFTFYETQQILQYSATHKKDFSAYKAALGFNAIQMYAGNLLAQPWRKEYRTMKTYCGFYKHQVEANLLGADKLFTAMGYRYCGEGLFILEGPICPDRVAAVSRDCLIAYVECQILKAIWEEVYKTFKISWLEVLEFRTNYICSPEQCIVALKSRYHRQYQEHTRSLSQGSANNYNVSIPVVTPVVPMNHSFPPSHHHHVGLPLQQEYAVVNGCCSGNYGNYTIPYSQPILRQPEYSYIPMATTVCPVPTAKLIEIDSSRSHDTVDHPNPPTERRQTKRPTENNYNNSVKNGLDPKDSQLKDWEYVYHTLESQGYTKDLGERGDILSPNSSKQNDDFKKIKQTNLDEAVRQFNVYDRPLKVSDTPKKPQKTPTNDNKAVSKEKATSEKSVHMQTLEKDKSAKKKLLNKFTNDGKPTNKWECKACTFINVTSKDICEMCSKSRIIKNETPIEIGGAECSKCTLVNSKNNNNCEACGTSLVGSPTYI